MNSLLSITSFTDSSDPKAVACLTSFPNEWKCIRSGVEVGVCLCVSMCAETNVTPYLPNISPSADERDSLP